MIYGTITNGFPENSKPLNKLKDLMVWEGCINQEIEFGNFKGGYVFDPRLPYKMDDFYFFSETNQQFVLMVGAIYNRDEIIDLLSIKDRILHNPELICKAFQFWGKDFVKELNGDFSIFIYQKHTNNHYLYRDHLGVKPIAFCNKENNFWFSSDGMALSKAIYFEEPVDKEFIQNHLIKWGLSFAPLVPSYTLLPNRKVRKVLPGHFLSITDSSVAEIKFWYPEKIKENRKLSFNSLLKETDLLLKDAVKIRCDQCFNASAHLSGGIDSGIVASIARKEYNKQAFFAGFSWTPLGLVEGEYEYDERNIITKLGEYIGVFSIFSNINAKNVISVLSDWRDSTGYANEIEIFEYCQSHQINLVFSGWGGDEFISINSIGIDSDLIFKLQWRSFFKKNPINNPKKIIGTILYDVVLPALSVRFYSRKKKLWRYSKYIKPSLKTVPKTINSLFNWRSRREMHLRYLYHYHITERIEDWNILGCRNGIEYRYPLIDKRIIELMMKVPSKLLSKKGYNRILIRELSEGLLPEEVRWNLSKNDPVREKLGQKLYDDTCKQLMNEMKEFKVNEVFDFINFDLLEKDIKEFNKGINIKNPSEQFEILFFLKKMHEFTKAYYN